MREVCGLGPCYVVEPAIHAGKGGDLVGLEDLG